MPPHAPDALLIVGHGTREVAGVAEFQQVVAQLAGCWPQVPISGCFLELVEPDIATALERLAAGGARRVAVVPLLLFAAGHALEDIPRQLELARQRWPQVETWQAPHLGCHPALLALSARRYQEALADLPAPATAEETLLLLVGRGSREPSANAECAQFARLRFEHLPAGWLELAFTALAQPSLERALELASLLPFRQVVVQPHLLFSGLLLERVRSLVAQAAAKHPRQRWLCTMPLGVSPELLTAISERAGLSSA